MRKRPATGPDYPDTPPEQAAVEAAIRAAAASLTPRPAKVTASKVTADKTAADKTRPAGRVRRKAAQPA